MARRGQGEVVLGILAAAFWSPTIYLFMRAATSMAGAAGTSSAGRLWPITFYFYVLLAATVVCTVMQLLVGRTRDFSVFYRRQHHVLVLAAVGVYGFWLLQALALERALRPMPSPQAGLLDRTHLLLYAGPLLLGVLSIPSREGARVRQVASLLLGFLGVLLIVRSMAPGGAAGAAYAGMNLAAVGAAACWAAFSLLARPLLREGKPLPILTIVLAVGAACMLVTSLTTGTGLLAIGRKALWIALLTGGVCVVFSLLAWLGALALAPPACVAPLWYLAPLLGVFWARVICGTRPGWWALGGAALILGGLYTELHGRRRQDMEDLTF